ncbi:MAG: primase-helicase zinc-binding domain-containing protein [Candidatus Devosia phytovorans]|uniref:Primase-helicase zinc-binding domain-containing protein n=1 Tax=Candidatus Devosia phytovorans TaxID=3121372 RepID=A0AAJ5VW12_9HYPH|nr:primase-helicase zinc-binding domain-containing protein [Devosia sp.]WEK04547.1 MAG: primase-helicase zinc-binding domain-containing protein [Devosia sp.]
MSLPPELASLRDEADAVTCWSWSSFKGWKLGPGPDKAGPCPNCGGTDRFAIHTTKNTFNCRRCGLSGHGVIDLVMKTEKVKFVPACEMITGRRVADPISAEEAARIHMEAQKREQDRAAEEDRRRLRAISEGRAIWGRTSQPEAVGAGGVADYLDLRGVGGLHFDRIMLREIARLDYIVEVTSDDGRKTYPVLHSGPAMVAAVVLPDGSFGAVHQTWIDLAQANGKVALHHPKKTNNDGSAFALPAKKVRGSKKGGAIKLYTPKTVTRIVMGEGIETTLTALRHNFEQNTAYWAGVDLGNMAGRAAIGFDNKRHEDEPNLDDLECFLPPDWCEELVFLCDSDEPETKTVEKVSRGMKRAQHFRDVARQTRPELPPLATAYVEPIGDGKDLNDLVRVGA